MVRLLPGTITGLAISFALLTATVTASLGLLTNNIVHEEIERQIDQRIQNETEALLGVYRHTGLVALAAAIDERGREPALPRTGYQVGVNDARRAVKYGLFDKGGKRVAGTLSHRPSRQWTEFLAFRKPDGREGRAQALATPLADGHLLVVAEDRFVVRRMDRILRRIFLIGFGIILVTGVAAAFLFGRIVHGRIAEIEQTAVKIIDGDIRKRMPLDGSGGEFDRLSLILNRMLDRMGGLLDNLRQVSSDIAHDLRTPLSRLRTRLAAAENTKDASERDALIAAASADSDALLELFSGILAIAEIEGQALRSRFSPVALAEAVEELVEAYGPSVENAGMALAVDLRPLTVWGDKRLLQRCIANLLDNALLHTPAGTRITVSLQERSGQAVLAIADDGPGVPEEEHARIFQRFVRLDGSRSTAGHGLGLNMVAAIVEAHQGTVRALPAAGKGLAVELWLPAV